VLPNINRTHAAEKGPKILYHFLSVVTLTFDPDLQTHASEGRNTSLAQIRYSSPFISYTNKNKQSDGAKNRTFRISLHVVMKHTITTHCSYSSCCLPSFNRTICRHERQSTFFCLTLPNVDQFSKFFQIRGNSRFIKKSTI